MLISTFFATTLLGQGTSDWRPSKMPAQQIAAKAESVMKSLTGADAAVSMKINMPLGNGVGYFTNQFKSPSVFHLEYPEYTKTGLAQTTLIVNTGRMARFSHLYPKVKTNAKDREFNVSSDAALVEDFAKEFSHYIFGSKLGGNATLGRFVAAASKGVNGYKVSVDERTMKQGSRQFKNFRIVAQRKKIGSKPETRIELVFDAGIGLPVNIQTNYGSYTAGWLCRWRNNQKFPAQPFVIPYK